MRQFETVSSLTSRDIDVAKIVLESIILKNRIEEIVPGQNKRSWEEDMREVQKRFRKKAVNYSEQEIEDIINEAVTEVRAEENYRKGGRSVGSLGDRFRLNVVRLHSSFQHTSVGDSALAQAEKTRLGKVCAQPLHFA